MAESETEISREELQKEIAEILDNASLENTSTKKVIQKLESKLGVDLTEKKKLIDQLVMDYVNSMDSDEESEEEEPPKKAPPKKKVKKEEVDEDDDDINDDSNDSDWGYHQHHDGHLLDGCSDDGYHVLPQESTVSTSGSTHTRHQRNGVQTRAAPTFHEDDEADIFGKLTAKKLRKLSDEQRDSMMVQINQLFYDKCHKRPPKRRMENKATSTAPAIHCEAKKIYRLEKTNVEADSPVAVALANLRDTIARSEVSLSSGARRPTAYTLEIPTDEIAKEKSNAHAQKPQGSGFNKCRVM